MEHVVSALSLDGAFDAADPGAEKRKTPRSYLGTTATIIPCGERASRRPFAVIVLNISETGVAIKNSPSLKRGDQFVLRLPSTDSQGVSAILCTVVYSRLMADGSDGIGAQFTRVLNVASPPQSQVESQREPFSPSPEDREHLRRLQERLLASRTMESQHKPRGLA
jgi:hypothetical protein